MVRMTMNELNAELTAEELRELEAAESSHRIELPAMEDRATQRCDLSASWLPKGRCHTVSLFSVAC